MDSVDICIISFAAVLVQQSGDLSTHSGPLGCDPGHDEGHAACNSGLVSPPRQSSSTEASDTKTSIPTAYVAITLGCTATRLILSQSGKCCFKSPAPRRSHKIWGGVSGHTQRDKGSVDVTNTDLTTSSEVQQPVSGNFGCLQGTAVLTRPRKGCAVTAF